MGVGAGEGIKELVADGDAHDIGAGVEQIVNRRRVPGGRFAHLPVP